MWCRNCSHRADVNREQCDCLMCSPPLLDVQILFPETLIVEPGSTLDVELPPVPSCKITEFDVPDWTGPEVPQGATNYSRNDDVYPAGSVQIDGRYFKSPRYQTRVMDSRVWVRIDDNEDSTQWMEVVIGEETLLEWLRLMRLADDAADDGSGIETGS